VPFLVVGMSLAENARDLTAATQRWLSSGPPQPPAWLAKVPVIGPRASAYWTNAAWDGKLLAKALEQRMQPTVAWLLSGGATLARGLADLALSILIAFFFYRDGGAAAAQLRRALTRIAGANGPRLLDLAGATVRSVVYGILGTALVQGVMAGVGFFVAGVPGAGLLGLLTCFLSIVPMGPPLVWLPAALWLFSRGSVGWGVFMLIWGVGVSTVDNFIKPWLISRGTDLPFVLILLGVLGGALAFGFVGVFLGPTLLAVGYRLVGEWAAPASPPAAPPIPSPAYSDSSQPASTR
jgi:predicted PurR-regulated permease PerM